MSKIYDVFPFNDELELLELRLQEHWEHVHRFVLVESSVNHRNEPKPLHFLDNRSRFGQYMEKIRHVVMPCYEHVCTYDPGNYRSGNCLDQQRSMGAMGLFDADDDDIILDCDVDELWRQEALELMLNDTHHMAFCPKQMMSHFAINFICAATSDPARCHGWVSWSKGMRKKYLKDHWRMDLTWVKSNTELSTITDGPTPWPHVAIINHGGWHFSWWGSKADHVAKLDSYGHSEQDTSMVRDLIASDYLIPRKMAAPDSIPQIGNMFPQHKWALCAIDDYYPRTILRDIDRYSKYAIDGEHPGAADVMPQVPICSIT